MSQFVSRREFLQASWTPAGAVALPAGLTTATPPAAQRPFRGTLNSAARLGRKIQNVIHHQGRDMPRSGERPRCFLAGEGSFHGRLR